MNLGQKKQSRAEKQSQGTRIFYNIKKFIKANLSTFWIYKVE